jgi:ABC-type oligopeptide transport system ATPase subunit
MNQEMIMEVKNLSVYFPRYGGVFRREVGAKKVLESISLTVKKGEVLGIVGQSGSGKSTLARAMIRLIEPSSGSLHFQGGEITHLNKNALFPFRKKMQMVFQDPYSSLNPRKSIGDTLLEPLLYHEIVENMECALDKIFSLLGKVGLSKDILERYPHQFSGGQQQRICIARALLLDPLLLFCDEVVSALDVSIQAQILNLLKELQENLSLSLVFISHDLAVVRYVCDRVIVLHEGQMCEMQNTEDLFNNPQHPYTKKLLSSTLSL